MSRSADLELLNKMLRDNQIEFSPPTKVSADPSDALFTFRGTGILQKGIEFALNNNNYKEIAKLEYEFNDGQPEKLTEKHLDWAKILIETEKQSKSPKVKQSSECLNFKSHIPISTFLNECHKVSQQNVPTFDIIADNKRVKLMSTLFGQFVEKKDVAELPQYDILPVYTQVIFDSADFKSAIAQLLISLSDRTLSPTRIRSVYIQESLKDAVHAMLTREKLNAANSSDSVWLSEFDKTNIVELSKKFGNKFVSNDNNTISLLFEVAQKYVTMPDAGVFARLPVTINFFRTTKEAIQLLNADHKNNDVADPVLSVWTENVNILYEVVAEANFNLIWSNSNWIGIRNGFTADINK